MDHVELEELIEKSYSQSHLCLEIQVVSDKEERGIITILDLVGFDGSFTQKIMDGTAQYSKSIIKSQKDQTHHHRTEFEDTIELDGVIKDYNDNALFSLRNLLISFENKEIEP